MAKGKGNATAMQTSTISNGKRNGMAPAEDSAVALVVIDGSKRMAREGERLIDLIRPRGRQTGPGLPPYATHRQPRVTADDQAPRQAAERDFTR